MTLLREFFTKSHIKVLLTILGILFIIIVLLSVYCLLKKYSDENKVSDPLLEDRVTTGNKSEPKKAPVGDHYIDERWANFQFCSDIELNYFGTKNIEMDTYDGDTIIKKLHRYEEKEGVFYTLDNQSRFYSIMNFNEKDATVDIGEEEIIKNIYNFLEGKIENLEDYKVDNIQKIEDCYEMQLKNSVDDIIDLEVESDGNIQSMLCRYNDGKELSNEEKQYFDTKFIDFLKGYLKEDETYKYTVSYAKIDEQICAFYSATFEDSDGITHVEIIIIT